MDEEIQQTTNEKHEPTETERIQLMKKIHDNRRQALVLNFVPSKIRERFDELAQKEFDGDYTPLLQRLLDAYEGMCSSGHEEIFMALEEFGAKISYLQQQVNEMKDKTKKPEGLWAGRQRR